MQCLAMNAATAVQPSNALHPASSFAFSLLTACPTKLRGSIVVSSYSIARLHKFCIREFVPCTQKSGPHFWKPAFKRDCECTKGRVPLLTAVIYRTTISLLDSQDFATTIWWQTKRPPPVKAAVDKGVLWSSGNAELLSTLIILLDRKEINPAW